MKVLSLIFTASLSLGFANPAIADVSPHLLIETMPSDNPNYRRMIIVHYLSGDRITVSYRAYNRAEFTQIPNAQTQNKSQCVSGKATTLSEIKSYQKDEKRRARRGQSPENRMFCIKNVQNWSGNNQTIYLDPIFETLPAAPKVSEIR